MNFEKLLDQIQTGQEKVAKAQTSAPTADGAVDSALKTVLAKTAAQATPGGIPVKESPANAILKVAQDMANNEKQAELLHSRECGRNFANALIETVAAADAAVKTAQLQEAQQAYHAASFRPEPTFHKQALEAVPENTDELVKVAAEAGYTDTMQKLAAQVGYNETMEKIAQVEFTQGQKQALSEIHKAASDEFVKGAMEVDALINLAQQRQGAQF